MILFQESALKSNKALSFTLFTFFMVLFLSGTVSAHGWKAPKEAADKTNPILVEKQSIDLGKDVFTLFCAACHGETAEGRSKAEANTRMDPPNLKKRLKNHTDGDFFWKIKNGNEDMPSFKEDLMDNEIWRVIIYIRDLLK